MNKKILSIILTLLLTIGIVNTTFADTMADEYFVSATIALTTYESASFSAIVNHTCSSIRIDSCWLQKYNGSAWYYYCWLPAPSDVDTNTASYDAYLDYSSYIPNDGGIYRIGAYFNADGHTIPRYSNSRTFN